MPPPAFYEDLRSSGTDKEVEGESRRMYSVSEASRILKVSTSYMRTLEEEGRIIPARRDERGGRIYTATELEILWRMGVGRRPGRLRFVSEVMKEMGVEPGPEVRV